MEQVVLREFATDFLHELLELGAFGGKAALQGARAYVKFVGHLLQRGTLAGKTACSAPSAGRASRKERA
jgi:hypothetical protein